ncbi:hypothetical protein ACFPZL_13990, partial [Leucobacter soli]|uniref:hypothetical protein n=1 Tax=Leucobacter soli TaxID=2812850 RepID=UPI0036153B64
MNETASTAPLAASIDDGAALPALSTEPSIDASSGVLADGSGAMPGEARLALWRIERDLWAPRTVRVTDASGRIDATAL